MYKDNNISKEITNIFFGSKKSLSEKHVQFLLNCNNFCALRRVRDRISKKVHFVYLITEHLLKSNMPEKYKIMNFFFEEYDAFRRQEVKKLASLAIEKNDIKLANIVSTRCVIPSSFIPQLQNYYKTHNNNPLRTIIMSYYNTSILDYEGRRIAERRYKKIFLKEKRGALVEFVMERLQKIYEEKKAKKEAKKAK